MEDLWTASSPGVGLNKYSGGTAEADACAAARVLAATGHVGNVHHIVDGRARLVTSIPAAEVCDECHATIPGDEPDMINAHHGESCSLHPGNVV